MGASEPGAQLEPFIAETEHGHWLGAEVDGCELKGRFVGHGPLPLVRGPKVGMIGGRSRPPSFSAFIARPLHRASVYGNPSFALISRPSTTLGEAAVPIDKKQLWGIGRPRFDRTVAPIVVTLHIH